MKLLFTDLDGTLLNHNSQVSAGTKAFLEEFLVSGGKLILSSGRPKDSVLEVMHDAGLNCPGILLSCSNGAQIYDPDHRRTILEQRLPLPYVAYLQQQAAKYGLHIQTYTENAIISPADDDAVRYYRRRIHLPLIVSPVLADALTEGPYKMLAIDLHDFHKLEAFRTEISNWQKIRYRPFIPMICIWNYFTMLPARATHSVLCAAITVYPYLMLTPQEMPKTISPCWKPPAQVLPC